MKFAAAVVCLLLCAVAGCAPGRPACLLASQRPMTDIDLYFGLAIGATDSVTDSQWSVFVDQVIAPHFPDGFTVLTASGQWRSPATGRTLGERSKLIRVVVTPAPDVAARVHQVTAAYMRWFNQASVGVVTGDVCAVF
jgi:hypothetical protein